MAPRWHAHIISHLHHCTQTVNEIEYWVIKLTWAHTVNLLKLFVRVSIKFFSVPFVFTTGWRPNEDEEEEDNDQTTTAISTHPNCHKNEEDKGQQEDGVEYKQEDTEMETGAWDASRAPGMFISFVLHTLLTINHLLRFSFFVPF